MLFALGFAALPAVLSTPNRVIGQAAALSAFVGSIAGAAMQVHFRSTAILAAAANSQAVDTLQRSSAIHFSTLVPGIFFPLGVIGLAVTLLTSKRATLPVCLALAIAAVLFPVGHAADITVARFTSDTMLLVACSLLASELSKQAELRPGRTRS